MKCPTPRKQEFTTERGAELYIEFLELELAEPYRCDARHWHVRSSRAAGSDRRKRLAAQHDRGEHTEFRPKCVKCIHASRKATT